MFRPPTARVGGRTISTSELGARNVEEFAPELLGSFEIETLVQIEANSQPLLVDLEASAQPGNEETQDLGIGVRHPDLSIALEPLADVKRNPNNQQLSPRELPDRFNAGAVEPLDLGELADVQAARPWRLGYRVGGSA